MLYVKMRGRLGNQLFRYAAARAFQETYCPNRELVLDWTIIDRKTQSDATFSRVLEEFRLAPHQSISLLEESRGVKDFFQVAHFVQILALNMFNRQHEKQAVSFGKGAQQMFNRRAFRKKWSRLLTKLGIYIFDIPKPSPFWRHQYFDHIFENPRYFERIRSILLEELTPKEEPPLKNLPLYQVIDQNNSVCVTIRRGDFESDLQLKDIYSVCNSTYFMKGIEEMASRLDNPVFIFFSDDINWVKEHIRVDYPSYYEDGTDTVSEKLRMMSSCKHFILSNSTFSWWAQWLSTYEEKIVISPNRWFNHGLTTDLISDEFITIEV